MSKDINPKKGKVVSKKEIKKVIKEKVPNTNKPKQPSEKVLSERDALINSIDNMVKRIQDMKEQVARVPLHRRKTILKMLDQVLFPYVAVSK